MLHPLFVGRTILKIEEFHDEHVFVTIHRSPASSLGRFLAGDSSLCSPDRLRRGSNGCRAYTHTIAAYIEPSNAHSYSRGDAGGEDCGGADDGESPGTLHLSASLCHDSGWRYRPVD